MTGPQDDIEALDSLLAQQKYQTVRKVLHNATSKQLQQQYMYLADALQHSTGTPQAALGLAEADTANITAIRRAFRRASSHSHCIAIVLHWMRKFVACIARGHACILVARLSSPAITT